MKYFASFSTNNGSTFGEGFTYTNLRKAVKAIREICSGNTFVGNTGHVMVQDESGHVVYSSPVSA